MDPMNYPLPPKDNVEPGRDLSALLWDIASAQAKVYDLQFKRSVPIYATGTFVNSVDCKELDL